VIVPAGVWGAVASTQGERFGEALWDAASVLKMAALPLAIAALIRLRSPGLAVGAAALIWAGNVLGDVGGRVALGQRVRLRRSSWVSIIVLLALTALAVASWGR
jgi:hypothetical protein